MDLRGVIKKRAIEIGFDLVGIAPATPGRDLEFARDWLKRGFGSEMRYLANPKRFDPRLVLPSVRSVICVGLVYDTPFPYSTEVGSAEESGVGSQESGGGSQKQEARNQKAEHGRRARVSNFEFPVSSARESARAWISRYAWGRDYHEVMREKLEGLRAAIEEMAPGLETRIYVDTGPVIERAFARFSGVGWMGKNTCLINEGKGSWFFLGIILTNLALEPDFPAPDRCGSCRACLDACPTGALVEPYVMDASRCISYLTIELKGSIPLELRAGVGANIFGCDICQDVCPWNRRSQESGFRSQEPGFQPITVSPTKREIGNWKLETGNPKFETRNSKLGSGQQSAVGSQPSTKDELRSTNDEKQLTAASSQQSGNFQSSIFNPQFSSPSTLSLFSPPLESLAAMTEGDFQEAFRHSPIKRARYRGWLRNLCVAMGNSGDTRLVPKLQELAHHSDPLVREHAEWALGQLDESKRNRNSEL